MKNDVSDKLLSEKNNITTDESTISHNEFDNNTNDASDNVMNNIETILKDHESRSTNYYIGFLGAFVGALIGAVPWGIVGSMGYFVGWLGFLISFLSSKGYDLCKVRTSKIKVVFVIISSVIAVFVGQIICDVIILKTDPDLSAHFSEDYKYYISKHMELEVYLSEIQQTLLPYAFPKFISIHL